MENQVSFSKIIRVNLCLLKISGILHASIGKISLTEISSILAFGLLATFTYAYTKSLLQSENVEVAMQYLAFATVIVGSTIRYLLIAGARVQLCDMLKVCQNLWEFLKIEEERVLISYISDAKKLTYFFLSQCAITIFLYAGAPMIFGNGFVRINGNVTERMLPYAFIMECQDSPCYDILYTIEILGIINVGISCVAIDTIGPLLILIASGHMKILQNRIMSLETPKEFENIKSDRVEQRCDQNITYERYVGKSLKESVTYHQTLLKLCKDIEKLMSKAFLVQMMSSTYSISAIGFKMAGNDSDKSKYVTQMVLSLLQLFLCNWPPDVLLKESEAVAHAAYFMPWYHCTKDVEKSVEIIIMRAQRVVHLTAGDFVNLSLETFVTMVSTAASFFTVLSSIQ